MDDTLIREFLQALVAVMLVLGGKSAAGKGSSVLRTWLVGDLEERIKKLEDEKNS